MHDRYVRGDFRYVRPERPAPRRAAGGGLALGRLDTSDILLLLVLYFLYKESGDEEFLIILAVTAFSIFGEK